MSQARALEGANQERDRLLHPGNAVLRRAIQENLVSFPSQIPVFSRQARRDMQWKAVLLYFVRGWPLCDIAARFGVGSHRIWKAIDEWATRAIALGYIQVIDAERFATFSRAEALDEESPARGIEQSGERGRPVEVGRLSLSRVSEESVASGGGRGWSPGGSLQPANAGLVTALDVAIRGCEDRAGKFYGEAATVLRDLRSAIEAGTGVHSAPPASWTSDVNNLSAAAQAPTEELLYAFKS